MLHSLLRLRLSCAAMLLMILLMLPFTTLSAATPKLSAETAVPLVVVSGADQGYTIKVLAIKDGSTLLIDLESMARALRLSPSRNQGTLVVEESLNMEGSLCTVTAGNNFVRVIPRDRALPNRVIQLHSAPLLTDSRIFLPLHQACRLFAVWLDRNIVYNVSSGRIDARLKGKRLGEPLGTIGIVREEAKRTSAESPTLPESGPTIISGINVENRANGAIISFTASGHATETSLLKPDADGYLYLSLEKASCDSDAVSKIYGSGIVKAINSKQFSGGGLQFTIALDTRSFVISSVEFQRDEKNNRYLLYIRSDADVEAIRRREKELRIAKVLSRDIEKWKINTIVLDAGHGGKDPGALGGNGTREKDVVINIVHDLGAFISQKWPEVNVIYTRKDDTFIPLHERGRIANLGGGKLFVSVHCNASPNRNARGSEVYILGLHKTKAALDVAMFENSVIRQEADYQQQYKGFSEEHLIMSTMAQNAFAKQSTTLAQDILKPVGKPSSSRGVRQAGFMVLWTPSMPSTLVEVGYLSNPEEEMILRDRQAQARIAYGIFQGLQLYRKNYELSTSAAMGH